MEDALLDRRLGQELFHRDLGSRFYGVAYVRVLRIEGSLVVDGLDLGGVEGYPLIHITAREERTVKPSRFEKGYDITFLVF